MHQIVINYWAVLVAAIANMVVGGLWYGPLFGKSWMRMMGFREEDKEKMGKAAQKSYIFAFLGSLLMAYVLAHVIDYGNYATNTSGVGGGLQAAFWSWLGFVAPVLAGQVLWEGKRKKLYLLNVFQYLAALLVMGAILGGWR